MSDLAEIVEKWQERARAWDELPVEEKRRRKQEWDRDEKEQKAAVIAERLISIPLRYQKVQLEHEAARAWLDGYLSGSSTGLLLAGRTGVGKTYLVWALFRAICEARGPRVEVVKLVSLLSALRPGGEADPLTVPRLCSVPLLMIDDLGAQKPSEWAEERLFEIIDTRYDALRPLVVTTNRKPENLAETIGERVASRLLESCEVLVLDGPSRRT